LGQDENVDTEQHVLVAPTTPNDFAFLASGRVSTGDRTQVTSGHVGANAATGDAVTAGFDDRFAVGKAVLGRRIVLKDRAVAGDLFATQVVAPFASYSSLSAFSAPPALPPIATFSAGSAAVTVNGGQTLTLASGNYGQVTINGTLRLSGGTYQVQNVILGNDAALIADATAKLRVLGRVTGADRVDITSAGALGAGALHLVVAGSTDATGGVTLGNDAQLKSLVLSRASVRTGDRLLASGAIAARNVAIGHESNFAFDTGFNCNSDAACDDANVCTTSLCVDGRCENTHVANGSSCSDGNACTQTDTCQSGACVGSDPVVCTASDQCHDAGTCDTSTGVCSDPAKPDGTPCDDSNSCSSGETCSGGECVGDVPQICEGGSGCGSAPCTALLSCTTSPECDDSEPCTTELCNSSTCAYTVDPTCTECPIHWQPSAMAPVFYGVRDYTVENGAPVSMRVFFPSLDGAVLSAPILLGCGRYPLVLFAHGNCSADSAHYRSWYTIPASLARSGYVVVVPNLPDVGAGLGPWTENHPDLERIDDTLTWMRTNWDYAGILLPGSIGIAGHSYGSLLAARYALESAGTSNEISAYASLSGVWSEWPSSPPRPIDSLGIPKLFLWGTGFGDTFANLGGLFATLPTPRHRAETADAEHFDYLNPSESSCAAGERGPCTSTGVLAREVNFTFFSKYMPPEHWASLEASLPDTLLLPPLMPDSFDQEFFMGAHRVAEQAFESSDECSAELEWSAGSTGTESVP
jgi:pimeloyl-ACP methyl ester carboxylesterase